MPALKHFSAPVGHAGLALESRVADLRILLGDIPADLLAHRAGASYLDLGPGRGEFHFSLLGRSVVLTYPDFRALTATGDSLPAIKQALLFYYFLTSDGTDPVGQWISFAELPEGRIYASAFQGYTGDSLAKHFGLNIDLFHSACRTSGGHPLEMGNAGYLFTSLPKMPLVVVYHLGDEEFPSACKILFDASASHHLPAEACAILGNMLAQQILRVIPGAIQGSA